MKKQTKRLIALILAIAMSLTLLGVDVWATEDKPLEDGSVSAEVNNELDCSPEATPEENETSDESEEETVSEQTCDETTEEAENEAEFDKSGGPQYVDDKSEQEETSESTQDTESVELDVQENQLDNAQTISLNQSYSGYITENTEKNYYKFTLNESGRINLRATAGMNYIYYRIYSAEGEQVWYDQFYWNNTTEQISTDEDIDLTSGTYCFCVEQCYDYTGSYSFTLYFTSADESFSESNGGSNNSMYSADRTYVNQYYYGQIAQNDEKDFYQFTLNQSGRISLTATAKMKYVYYRIYDSSGTQLWYDQFYWNNTTEQISTNVDVDLTSGTYYFCVEQSYDYTGNYNFSLNYTSANESFSESDVSNNNSMETANSISLNQNYNGQIAINDDKDFYKFSVYQDCRINLVATAQIENIYYRIYDASGNKIWSDSYYWNNTTKRIETSENIVLNSGTYYYCVERYSDYTGPFSFTLSQKASPYLSNATISLSSSWYTYDGNRKQPSVTVKLGDEYLTEYDDYYVSYSNNLNAGTATVTVSGRGEYSGTVTKNFTIAKASGYVSAQNVSKNSYYAEQSFYLSAYGSDTLSYESDNSNIQVNQYGRVTVKGSYAGNAYITITSSGSGNYSSAEKTIKVTVTPLKTSLSSVYADGGGKASVYWNWTSSGNGYQIQYSTSKSFSNGNKSKKVNGYNTSYVQLKKLKKGKTYYIRIRTKCGSSYSGWSKAKKVKIY